VEICAADASRRREKGEEEAEDVEVGGPQLIRLSPLSRVDRERLTCADENNERQKEKESVYRRLPPSPLLLPCIRPKKRKLCNANRDGARQYEERVVKKERSYYPSPRRWRSERRCWRT